MNAKDHADMVQRQSPVTSHVVEGKFTAVTLRGMKVYCHHGTPVAVVLPNGERYRTDTKYSTTTSRILNRFCPASRFSPVSDPELIQHIYAGLNAILSDRTDTEEAR